MSLLAACGDLITAVFDFAHAVCALKLTEHQIALFSALVLINTGKTNSPASRLAFSVLETLNSRITNRFQTGIFPVYVFRLFGLLFEVQPRQLNILRKQLTHLVDDRYVLVITNN